MKPNTKHLFILFILSLALFFPWLGKTPLWILDEVRNAECAREMYERGDWIVPTFNGELRTLKPPLHYYFMFGGFRLFGITEWGARFFSAMMGLFTIVVTYLFVSRFSTARHALISAIVLLSSTHFLFQYRMSVPDPYLIFLNTVSLFTAFAYFREKKFFWLLICAITLGLGTLTKGPVSIALPGLAIIAWLVWEKKWKEVFSLKIFAAGLLVLIIAMPWYWLVHRETNGEWTRGFFIDHNINRFSSEMEGHGGPFILVPLFVFIGLLPAGVFIGEALKKFRLRSVDPLWKLAVCIIAVYVFFYGISSTKLPNYPMPCYPFAAILLGKVIDQIWDETGVIKKYPFIILVIINFSLPVIGYWALKIEANTTGMENMAFFLLLPAVASLAAWVFAYRKQFKKALISLYILYFPFHLIFFSHLYPLVYKQTPLSRTIEIVRKYDLVIGYYQFHPSFTFYLHERIPHFQNADSLRLYLENKRAVIISYQRKAEELHSIGLQELASVHDLFENKTTVIFATSETETQK